MANIELKLNLEEILNKNRDMGCTISNLVYEVYRLREIIDKVPIHECNKVYCDRPAGWSCINEMEQARDNKREYSDAYRKKLIEGKHLCYSCSVKLILLEFKNA